MLTDQVQEPFGGREGLTKLYSMVRLYDMKKIDLVFMQLVAVCSWLMTVDERRHIEQVTTEVLGIVLDCRSYPWTVLAAVAVDHAAADGPVGKLRKKNTDLDCARNCVDAPFG